MQGPLQFDNGGFVLHKIHLDGMKSKVSAWFDKDGKLLDCEAIDIRGRPRKVDVRRHEQLEHIGARYKHIPAASEEDVKKTLINEILICAKANDIPITGDLFFGLAFRTVSELRQISQELHIQVKK